MLAVLTRIRHAGVYSTLGHCMLPVDRDGCPQAMKEAGDLGMKTMCCTVPALFSTYLWEPVREEGVIRVQLLVELY